MLILLQLDACRHDYINENNAPFLSNLKKGGLSGLLLPTFGFEPDAAYMAGLYPDEADGGAQFWYDPSGSPFSLLRTWSRALNRLSEFPERVLRRLVRLITQLHCSSPALSTCGVPFHLLRYFGFPMKCSIENPDFVEKKTIFDLLRDADRIWLYHGSPYHKVDLSSVIQRVERDLFHPIEFAFFHIGDLDRAGHKYGPNSQEIKATLKRIDKGIETIWGILGNRYEQVHLVLFGDHGMMEVGSTLDIWSELEKLSVEHERDFIVFLDSTMARFWFFSENAEKTIMDLLTDIPSGHVLSQDEKDKYHLNYSHNRFGDVTFLADPGVLIFPNFYQNKKTVKGMHGYAPETAEQQSALLIHSPQISEPKCLEEPVDMRRIFPTILDLIDLPIPEGTKVESLLQQF